MILDRQICLDILNSPHININETPTLDEKFDLGIVIIPKNNPNVDLKKFRGYCEKVGHFGEATLVLSRL